MIFDAAADAAALDFTPFTRCAEYASIYAFFRHEAPPLFPPCARVADGLTRLRHHIDHFIAA